MFRINMIFVSKSPIIQPSKVLVWTVLAKGQTALYGEMKMLHLYVKFHLYQNNPKYSNTFLPYLPQNIQPLKH